MTHYSDEDLTAYLDGEMPDIERERLERALGADPLLVERLNDLEVSIEEIRKGFDSLLDAAPRYKTPQQDNRVQHWRIPALVASIFVVGVLLGSLWNPLFGRATMDDWKLAIAKYQVLYVTETLAGQTPPPTQIADQLKGLSERLSRDLSTASELEGLHFRRAQMLGLGPKPLIQIAYLSGSGEPYALCITPVDESAYAPKATQLEGLAASHWVNDGLGFLIIGGDNLALVQNLAERLHGRI